MTPWQLSICAEGEADLREAETESGIAYAWYNAAFTRAKKLVPLKEVLRKKEPVKVIDEHAIMARLKAYSKRRGDI